MMKITKHKLLNKMVIWVLVLLINPFISSCDKMEDNYEQYMVSRIYPPRVTNLQAIVGYKNVTLTWQNPKSDIVKKIILKYDDVEITFDKTIETAFVDGLEIKGYEMVVQTQDAYGNHSVPASVNIFPNGED